jgi:hypothetical protein
MKQKTKDWIIFAAVMVAFLIGMIALMLNEIEQLWVWIIFIGVWIFAEMKIAKNIQLKWWIWVIIIAVILGIDLLIISIIN